MPAHPDPAERRPLASADRYAPGRAARRRSRPGSLPRSRPSRDEILDLSHRIHADPGAGLRGAPRLGLGRRGAGASRLRRSSTRPAAWPPPFRATRRGGRGGDGPRIGILAEYDALPGLGHGCGHNTMAASGVGAAIALASLADELPGEIVFLGTPAEERGSGKQIMIDDGLFDGLDAALLYHPCDRDHVESLSARVRGRRRRLHGPPVARVVGSVARQERARRADPAVHLGRAVAPAAPADARASTGSSARAARPPTSSRTGPSAWFMIRSDDEADYETMRDRFRELCEAAALATDTTVEVTFSGRARTMRNNRGPGRAVPGQHGRLRHRRPGRRPERGHRPTWPTSAGSARPSTPTSPSRPRARPATRSSSATRPSTPRADEVTLLAATLVAQTALELFATRPSSRPPGRSSAETD